MILSTVSLKGGAGKTTIAVNLAVEFAHRGEKVALVDADANNLNALTWAGLRPDNLPKVFTTSLTDPQALQKNIGELNANYDIVIIDGTPAMKHQTGIIMLVSDLVLLPFRSSGYDLWAFHNQFLPKLQDVRMLKPDLDCRVVRNALRKTVLARDILEVLEENDIPIMHRTFKLRTVYESTPLEGIGVTETASSEASVVDARFEIKMFAEEVSQILNPVSA